MKTNQFEVEDIDARKNYVFKMVGPTVELWDTSLGRGRELMMTFPDEASFPFGCVNAGNYFQHVYEKSLKCVDNVCFIGFVGEDFQPIEE